MHHPTENMLVSIIEQIRKLPSDYLGTIFDLMEKLLGTKGEIWLDDLKKLLRKEPEVITTPILHDDLTHVSTFEVEVPKDFTLDACPRTGFTKWNENITDANFPNGGLVPGKKYIAEVYRLNCDKSSQSLVDIGLAHKRVLGGAKGGALLCNRYGGKLPRDRWVIAIDETKNLWHGSDAAAIPGFIRFEGGWFFNLSGLTNWNVGYYVLFFYELN